MKDILTEMKNNYTRGNGTDNQISDLAKSKAKNPVTTTRKKNPQQMRIVKGTTRTTSSVQH